MGQSWFYFLFFSAALTLCHASGITNRWGTSALTKLWISMKALHSQCRKPKKLWVGCTFYGRPRYWANYCGPPFYPTVLETLKQSDIQFESRVHHSSVNPKKSLGRALCTYTYTPLHIQLQNVITLSNGFKLGITTFFMVYPTISVCLKPKNSNFIEKYLKIQSNMRGGSGLYGSIRVKGQMGTINTYTLVYSTIDCHH